MILRRYELRYFMGDDRMDMTHRTFTLRGAGFRWTVAWEAARDIALGRYFLGLTDDMRSALTLRCEVMDRRTGEFVKRFR